MSLFVQYIPAQRRCQKEKPIHSRILGICESILLFCLFFLPALLFPRVEPLRIEFSSYLALQRFFFIDIPGALICLLLLARNTSLKEFALKLPSLKDIQFFPLLTALLLSLSLAIKSIELALFSLLPIQNIHHQVSNSAVVIIGPIGIGQWILCVGSSFGSALIEESFFRSHVLTRLRQAGISSWLRIFLSAGLFASCHLYLGIGPMLFSFFAGFILACFYEKGSSLYLLTLSHTAYNVLIWIQMSRF